ncbi:MAG: hypothetical protein GC131_06390 [Alphaproteobacteria bacterium]|nr:hypothetical protein [Alphaproteobacteria bacterium]
MVLTSAGIAFVAAAVAVTAGYARWDWMSAMPQTAAGKTAAFVLNTVLLVSGGAGVFFGTAAVAPYIAYIL